MNGVAPHHWVLFRAGTGTGTETDVKPAAKRTTSGWAMVLPA